jgi:hypothetical protein
LSNYIAFLSYPSKVHYVNTKFVLDLGDKGNKGGRGNKKRTKLFIKKQWTYDEMPVSTIIPMLHQIQITSILIVVNTAPPTYPWIGSITRFILKVITFDITSFFTMTQCSDNLNSKDLWLMSILSPFFLFLTFLTWYLAGRYYINFTKERANEKLSVELEKKRKMAWGAKIATFHHGNGGSGSKSSLFQIKNQFKKKSTADTDVTLVRNYSKQDRQKAIQKCGGIEAWKKMTAEERLNILKSPAATLENDMIAEEKAEELVKEFSKEERQKAITSSGGKERWSKMTWKVRLNVLQSPALSTIKMENKDTTTMTEAKAEIVVKGYSKEEKQNAIISSGGKGKWSTMKWIDKLKKLQEMDSNNETLVKRYSKASRQSGIALSGGKEIWCDLTWKERLNILIKNEKKVVLVPPSRNSDSGSSSGSSSSSSGGSGNSGSSSSGSGSSSSGSDSHEDVLHGYSSEEEVKEEIVHETLEEKKIRINFIKLKNRRLKRKTILERIILRGGSISYFVGIYGIVTKRCFEIFSCDSNNFIWSIASSGSSSINNSNTSSSLVDYTPDDSCPFAPSYPYSPYPYPTNVANRGYGIFGIFMMFVYCILPFVFIISYALKNRDKKYGHLNKLNGKSR